MPGTSTATLQHGENGATNPVTLQAALSRERPMMPPLPVLHVITRLIVGGAQRFAQMHALTGQNATKVTSGGNCGILQTGLTWR